MSAAMGGRDFDKIRQKKQEVDFICFGCTLFNFVVVLTPNQYDDGQIIKIVNAPIVHCNYIHHKKNI